MPTIDIFDKPFDEGTIAKLEIFENYLDSWLPTFVLSKYSKPIQLFDLFAGAGKDKDSIEGSPLRALRIIMKHGPKLRSKNKKIFLYFNDFDKDKVLSLNNLCAEKISEYKISDIVELRISNLTFSDFLKKHKKIIDYGCNLIFIDQNGFKEVTENVFKYLINIEQSEFIFFISSNYLRRFAEDHEVIKFHPKFDFTAIKNSDRKIVHNIVCREFEKYVPEKINSYSLIPFSIMKEDKNNVYGLVFVSKHIRGADKFLDVAWKMNNINGNANFDIDDDLKKDQIGIWEMNKPKKIEAFQKKLEEYILSKRLTNNVDVFIFTLNEGHIPKHAHRTIMNLKRNKVISFEGLSPLVNYRSIYNENRIIEFKVLLR